MGAAQELWRQVRHNSIRIAATDGNFSYHRAIRKPTQHIVDKAETCLVEAKNSSMRDMLARLNRKTKRYSKCPIMLRQAITMWRFKEIALSIYK